MKKNVLLIISIILISALIILTACADESNSSFLQNTTSKTDAVSPSVQTQPSSTETTKSTNSQSQISTKISTTQSSYNESSPFTCASQSVNTEQEVENNQTENVLGVWWWSDSLGDEYFDFVISRGVNEIYYSSSKFNNETAEFITKAKTYDIKVFCLTGAYQWLDDDANLHTKIASYLQYQSAYPNAQYSGIHLDVEPHQHPSWKGTDKTSPVRIELVQKLVDLASRLKSTYSTIHFDYDIPFWLDYEISYNSSSKMGYEAIIDIADRVFIMSYRDTSEAIYDISSEEIAYANSIGKKVVLGIETYSQEGDNVSFWEEGETAMLEEMQKLKATYPNEFGLCVHHAKKWYELSTK